MIEHNFFHTGVALTQIFENRSNVNIGFYSVVRNASTSTPASKKVVLNSFAFAILLQGPSVKGIEEALKRIGVKDFDWDNVGSAGPVKSAFKTQDTRDTTKLVIEYLQNAAKIRNNIVHRGDNIQPIVEIDLRQTIAIFNSVGDALAEFLRKAAS